MAVSKGSSGEGERERPPRGEGGSPPSRKSYYRRRKVCRFCQEKIDVIDYKDVRLIGQFVSERGKILPRRLTGTCSPHQRRLTDAIKRARNIAFLPFVTEV